MKTFKQFINEGVLDILSPKSSSDIDKELDRLSDFGKLLKIIEFDLPTEHIPKDKWGFRNLLVKYIKKTVNYNINRSTETSKFISFGTIEELEMGNLSGDKNNDNYKNLLWKVYDDHIIVVVQEDLVTYIGNYSVYFNDMDLKSLFKVFKAVTSSMTYSDYMNFLNTINDIESREKSKNVNENIKNILQPKSDEEVSDTRRSLTSYIKSVSTTNGGKIEGSIGIRLKLSNGNVVPAFVTAIYPDKLTIYSPRANQNKGEEYDISYDELTNMDVLEIERRLKIGVDNGKFSSPK